MGFHNPKMIDWTKGVVVAPAANRFDHDNDPDTPQGPKFGWGGRMMGGDAYNHNLGLDGQVTGGSWLQSFTVGDGAQTVTALDYFEDQAGFAWVVSGGIAVTGAARTDGGPLTAIGGAFAGINIAGTQKAYGLYIEAARANSAVGDANGIEVNTTNRAGPSPWGGANPYKDYVTGMTNVIRVAGGNDGATAWGFGYAVDAGIEFTNNGASMHTGINFRFGALLHEGQADVPRSPAQHASYARAIAFPYQAGLSWFSRDPLGAGGTQTESVRIYSTVTDPAVLWGQSFSDSAWQVFDRVNPSQAHLAVNYREDAVAAVAVTPGTASLDPLLAAQSATVNANLRLDGAGTGMVEFVKGFDVQNLEEAADDTAAAAAGVAVGQTYRTAGGEIRWRVS